MNNDTKVPLEESLATETRASTVLDDVKVATQEEHDLSVWQALKKYPQAAAWSIAISTAVIMEGYDTYLLGNFYAFPAFQRKFGTQLKDGKYNISAPWQAGLSDIGKVGAIFGIFLNGYVVDRFGYKKVAAASLLAISCLVLMEFFAPNIEVLLVSQLLIYIPFGIFQVLSTVYAAEVCPMVLRPYLTTYVNLCWSFGKFIGAGVLRAFVKSTSHWAYKIPFAIQWAWILPMMTLVYFAPESPWWLVRHGKYEDAKKSLRRLRSSQMRGPADVEVSLALIDYTVQHEQALQAGSSYLDCFKGINLRRTEIACAAWSIQPLCGYSLGGSSTYFFLQAGLSSTSAFNFGLGQTALGIVGGLVSWTAINRMGRRWLYVYGLAGLFVTLLMTGILGSPRQNGGLAWATASMPLLFIIIYDMTIGPVCYTIVSETPAAQLRVKTVSLARNAYNVFTLINNILTAYQINAANWNWKGKAGYFWAASCGFCFLWTYFRLPEMKGRTYGELDVLFENKTPARQFQSADVEIFEGVEKTSEVVDKS